MTWQPYDSRGRPNTPRSDPHDLGQVDRLLRDRLWTAAHLSPTFVRTGRAGLVWVSLYRDPGRQWDLRAERVGIAHAWDNSYKGSPVTAVPGRYDPASGLWLGGSHHGLRGAGIGAGDVGGPDLQWLIDNRAMLGLGLTVRSENWHFEPTGIDSRTRKRIGAPTVPILTYPGPSWDDPITQPKEWDEMASKAEIQQAVTDALAPFVTEQKRQAGVLSKLEADYLTTGKGVRQTIVETDKRTQEIVTDTRALTKPKG